LDRYGIATAGNFIVDRVKIIDHWPAQDTLSRILSEQRGTGGGAYNSLCDLRNLGVELPLSAIGCLGPDADGDWIRADLTVRGVNLDRLRVCPEAATSYTDVMTVQADGRRTFFHHLGASVALGPADFADPPPARVLHLAYLLLLPGLDQRDRQFGSVGARVLAGLRAAGLLTVLDIVSEDSPRVAGIVGPALAHTDCLVINELEAGVLTGLTVRQPDGAADPQQLRAAAAKLLEAGVKQMVAIHLPEGGYARRADGAERFQPSLNLPPGYIQGAAGAGDAFAAGILYGLHESWELGPMLELAVATAAACLRHPTCAAGVGPLAETLGLIETYGLRSWPALPD
jgi:sugar/nucleoside kinase (ribokinase family)